MINIVEPAPLRARSARRRAAAVVDDAEARRAGPSRCHHRSNTVEASGDSSRTTAFSRVSISGWIRRLHGNPRRERRTPWRRGVAAQRRRRREHARVRSPAIMAHAGETRSAIARRTTSPTSAPHFEQSLDRVGDKAPTRTIVSRRCLVLGVVLAFFDSAAADHPRRRAAQRAGGPLARRRCRRRGAQPDARRARFMHRLNGTLSARRSRGRQARAPGHQERADPRDHLPRRSVAARVRIPSQRSLTRSTGRSRTVENAEQGSLSRYLAASPPKAAALREQRSSPCGRLDDAFDGELLAAPEARGFVPLGVGRPPGRHALRARQHAERRGHGRAPAATRRRRRARSLGAAAVAFVGDEARLDAICAAAPVAGSS